MEEGASSEVDHFDRKHLSVGNVQYLCCNWL